MSRLLNEEDLQKLEDLRELSDLYSDTSGYKKFTGQLKLSQHIGFIALSPGFFIATYFSGDTGDPERLIAIFGLIACFMHPTSRHFPLFVRRILKRTIGGAIIILSLMMIIKELSHHSNEPRSTICEIRINLAESIVPQNRCRVSISAQNLNDAGTDCECTIRYSSEMSSTGTSRTGGTIFTNRPD